MANDFHKQIEEWKKKNEAKYIAAIKEAILELFKRIILETPVATGRARANWQISIDSKGPESSLVDTDPTGQATIAKVEAELKKVTKLTQFVTLRNNLAYILSLEYGSSKQSPAGMVHINTMVWDDIVAKAVKKVKGS